MAVSQDSVGQLALTGALAIRAATALQHASVERALELPGAIQTLADYRRWLTRFYGIYLPLEQHFAAFSDWESWNIRLEDRGQSIALRRDLTALGCEVPAIELAGAASLPPMDCFADALGALYVLEGSKLGGRFMLKEVAGRLGPAIDGADAFFAGHGPQTMTMWTEFRSALDRFSVERPGEFAKVIESAKRTFLMIELWMTPAAHPIEIGPQWIRPRVTS